MPINAHPDFLEAEKEYLAAESPEEKIEKLKKMISYAPGHKGAENLRAQLKTRLKKFQQQLDKSKKSSSKSGSKNSIKKEDMQAIIIGKTNSGKSTLLQELTNTSPEISPGEFAKFTTKQPIQGILKYKNINIQIIENPAIESEYYDRGLTNTADTILILVNNLEQIKEIEEKLPTSPLMKTKKIIIFNIKKDLSSQEKRKTKETLKSKFKKYDFILISLKNLNLEKLNELKEKILQSFDKIRIYTKQPLQSTEEAKKSKPVILKPNSRVQDVAEKILKGFSKKIKQTRVWGPSSKFPGQKIGLKHKLKDLDIIEFKTK
ncbi:50S ribosome-binding GTPase [Candidatus Pacearchaeota archaeon]|nr:50S ribosome-binding GTPase [Candidatus Pacearchaeota archaeon]